jgi:anti-sigma factor ChrR (cupin superfamily)
VETAPAEATGDGPNLRGVAEGFLVVRAGEGEWLPTGDAGVAYKLLFADPGRGTVTTLVRMQPGSRIRSHRHLGVEQCLVLEGDVSSGAIRMTAGDFNCSLPGSVHEELVTDRGALLLLVSPERYEPVETHAPAHG